MTSGRIMRARRRNGTRRAETSDRSQRDHAYAEIKRRILDSELPPGCRMLETEVAALLGMSRTPVREALIRLADERLVSIRPRHGMTVCPVSPDDMREIYEILASLETTAAALAADRGLADHEIAELEKAVAEMDAALERDDLRGWADADEMFHDLLVAGSGNSRLRTIVDTMKDQAHRVRVMTLRLRPRPVASNEDHRALVEAIRRRDAAAAARLHDEHRRRSGTMLVDLLRKHAEGGM